MQHAIDRVESVVVSLSSSRCLTSLSIVSISAVVLQYSVIFIMDPAFQNSECMLSPLLRTCSTSESSHTHPLFCPSSPMQEITGTLISFT